MIKHAVQDIDGKLAIVDKKLVAFFNSFNTEPDIGLVAIVAAIVDERLRAAMKSFLIPDKESKLFVEHNLQGMESVNRACFCLGLITRREFTRIEWIRELRNAFVHMPRQDAIQGTLEAKRDEVFRALETFLPGIDADAVGTARKAFIELGEDIVWRLWERPIAVDEEGLAAKERVHLQASHPFSFSLGDTHSDRSTALLVVNELENVLRELLRGFLVQSPVSEELVHRNAPCLNLLNRLCFCSGLISRNEFELIAGISRLRNKFAHCLMHEDFDGTFESKRKQVFEDYDRCMPLNTRPAKARHAFELLAGAALEQVWGRDEEIVKAGQIIEERAD